MMLLELPAEMCLGIEEIDDQHARFFAMLHELQEAVEGQAAESALADVIDDLSYYFFDHFTTEERIMAERGYSALAHHKHLHQCFIARVIEFHHRLEEGDPELGPAMLHFLATWFENHIRNEDLKIVSGCDDD